MTHSKQPDQWNSGGGYEAYVGRWSRLAAHEFLNWLNVPLGARWLDVGCGTGALTETILRYANPSEVQGVDGSDTYATFVRDHIRDPRVHFEVSDAQALNIADHTFNAVVSGLMLNFVLDPNAALHEMVRVVKSGGVVAAYVWDYTDGMQMMRHFWDAAVALHPEALELDEGRRFPLCQPEPLQDLFQRGGLGHVEVRSLDIPTHFRNFEDYWSPFLGGQGPAPTFVMSLAEVQRDQLRDYLQTRLPINANGSIDLVARAWAVRGIRA